MLFKIHNFPHFPYFFFIKIFLIFFLPKFPQNTHTKRIGLISNSLNIQPHLLAITLQFDLHLPNIILQLRNLNLKLMSLLHLSSYLFLIFFPKAKLITLKHRNPWGKDINFIFVHFYCLSYIQIVFYGLFCF